MLRFFDKDNRDITDDYRVYCKNPACHGEPWCGICKGNLQPEPEQVAEMQEASALEQEYDKPFQELSKQESSTPRGTPTPPLSTLFPQLSSIHQPLKVILIHSRQQYQL